MNSILNRLKVMEYRLENDTGELSSNEKHRLQLLQKEYEKQLLQNQIEQMKKVHQTELNEKQKQIDELKKQIKENQSTTTLNETQQIILSKELTRKSTKRFKRNNECLYQIKNISNEKISQNQKEKDEVKHQWKITVKDIPENIKIVGIHKHSNEINNQFLYLFYVKNNSIQFVVNEKDDYDICGYVDSFENIAIGFINTSEMK